MKKVVLNVALSGCLAAGVAAVAGPAIGSMRLPSVVVEDPVNYTPNVVDDERVPHTSVDALARLGDTLYAGGKFHVVERRGTTYQRNHLMSFSASTGEMTSFAPDLDGRVFALLARGDSVYVGGFFKNVDGVFRRGLAKLDAATGAVDTAFDANLKGRVQEIRMSNGRLLVGGTFPQKLLALDPATGADTGYIDVPIAGTVASNAGPTDIYRFAVSRQGTRLVAVGNFTTVAGQVRWRAFMLNLDESSATLNPWYYPPLRNSCRGVKVPAYLRDVDFSPNGRYFVMDSTGWIPRRGGVGRDICDAAARFETNQPSPTRPTWINYSGGDTFHSILATGTAVYVQGHFRALNNPNGTDGWVPGAVRRQGIGAIDPVTGKALRWNPGKTRAVGGKDMLATPQGLWVGSDGARFNGERRDNIAFVPLP